MILLLDQVVTLTLDSGDSHSVVNERRVDIYLKEALI